MTHARITFDVIRCASGGWYLVLHGDHDFVLGWYDTRSEALAAS